MIKRYICYLLRWQLSTFILAPIIAMLSNCNAWVAAAVANLIGGLIFFWVDRHIFATPTYALWQIREKVVCADCGHEAKGFRLVKTRNYDRTNDKRPEFRCEICSEKKTKELKQKGVKL